MLLAQDVSTKTASEAFSDWLFNSPMPFVFFFLLLIAVVAIVVGRMVLRHLHYERATLHEERIRALEAGIPPNMVEPSKEQGKFLYHAYWISFWMGGVVPIVSVCSAAFAVSEAGIKELATLLAIYSGAGGVGIAGVGGATLVMLAASRRWPFGNRQQGTQDQQESYPIPPAKPTPMRMAETMAHE